MLNKLFINYGTKARKKNLGRGVGSGKGKTCGRGTKGQNSRSGASKTNFEGGQTPISIRLPKRGFSSKKKNIYKIIPIIKIKKLFLNRKVGNFISLIDLAKLEIFKLGKRRIKILGKWDCFQKISIETHNTTKKLLTCKKKTNFFIKQ